MITQQQIEALAVGEKLVDGLMWVERLQDTKTGKPVYRACAYRAEPRFAAGYDSYTAKGAVKNLARYPRLLAEMK